MKSFILGLLSLGLVAPVGAYENTVGGHVPLAKAVNEISSFEVNTLRCFQGDMSGYYVLSTGAVVVCQDNARKIGVMVDWTSNDLDTLRHEAHHLLQDCMKGGIGDRQSILFFETLTPSIEALGPERVSTIREVYAGASNDVMNMEIEAFAVATYVSPNNIASSIKRFCS
jgi:hypothetical protein